MTREEVIKEIQEVARHCRGNLPSGARRLIAELLEAGRADLAEKIDAANRGRSEGEPYVAALSESGDRRRKVQALFSDGTVDEYVVPPVCGYDFNQTIIDGPFDGREHEYQCPRCGVTGWYQAPSMRG